MLRLQDPESARLHARPDLGREEGTAGAISLEDYLLDVAKVDKQCLWFFMTTGRGNFCVGADAIPGAVRVGDGCAGVCRV